MSEPNRPDPNPRPDLAKLSAQGYARRKNEGESAEVTAAKRAEQSENVNGALAIYLNSSRNKAPLVLMAIGIVAIPVALLTARWLAPLCACVAFLGFFVWYQSWPRATDDEVSRELAWTASFPFELTGYFDVLALTPSSSRQLVYEVRWREGTNAPTFDILEGLFALADPGAHVERVDERGARIRSSFLDGNTGIFVRKRFVYRNHKLAENVHAIVEKALVPLDQNHAIESVTIDA